MLSYLDIKISVVMQTTLRNFSRIILNLAKFPNELFGPKFWLTSELGQVCDLAPLEDLLTLLAKAEQRGHNSLTEPVGLIDSLGHFAHRLMAYLLLILRTAAAAYQMTVCLVVKKLSRVMGPNPAGRWAFSLLISYLSSAYLKMSDKDFQQN